MVVLHAFLALAAGFATIIFLMVFLTWLFKQIVPHWAEDGNQGAIGYFLTSLASTLVPSACGGYVTAWLAVSNPLDHALALAIAVLVMAALSALQERSYQSLWQKLVLVVLTPTGVVAGGLVRLLVLGIL